MPKYTPSFVDVSGFNKALSDQLYRNAQINLRREQVLDREISQFDRLYTGKIRPVDMNEFADKFNTYRNVSKGFMNANRSGVPGNGIMNISMNRDMAKKDMVEFSDKSRIVGEKQKMLAQYPKDKIRDTDTFYKVNSDLATKSVSQLEEEYKGIENIPTVFEFKPQNFNLSKFQNSVKALYSVTPKQPNQWMPATKNGVELFEDESFTITDDNGAPTNVVVKVPLKESTLSVNPSVIRQAVSIAALSDSSFATKDFLNKYRDDIIGNATNQQDPNLAADSTALVQYAMNAYGRNSPEELTGADLYSAFLAKSMDLGKVVVKDYDRLGDMYNIAAKQAGLNMSKKRLEEFNRQKARSVRDSEIRALNAVMNTLRTSSNLGLFGLDETGDEIINIIKRIMPNLGIKESTLKDALKNKRNIAEEEIEDISEDAYKK